MNTPEKDPLIEKLLVIGSMDGNQAIARTAYEAVEAIQYWKDRAHDRVGRDYHRRELTSAGILGFIAGSAFVAFISILMWKVLI
jgi:hypothetical protein